MPTRILLTSELVDNAPSPGEGERWIADTELRGFGLRLWATKSGQKGRAFAIRTTDSNGQAIRRSADYWDLYFINRWRFRHPPPSLGALLPEARNWARDEIDRAKNRPTLADERQTQTLRSQALFAGVTLEQAAQASLQRMALRGISQPYRDRLDKLFAQHVPRVLQSRRILDITEADIFEILRSKAILPGNLRILRPFIGNIFDLSLEFRTRGKVSSYNIRRMEIPEVDSDAWKEIEPDRIESLFSFLENFEEYWQQSYCLRLFLDLHAPLSKLMSARWDELFDTRYKDISHNNSHFWRREWRHTDGIMGTQMLTKRQNSIVMRLNELGAEQFPASLYWFPSKHGRTMGHIRSIEHTWRLALAEVGSSYLSPRRLRASYQTHRSYLRGWLDEDRLFVPDPAAK